MARRGEEGNTAVKMHIISHKFAFSGKSFKAAGLKDQGGQGTIISNPRIKC